MFLSWGWNGSAYSRSDIHFSGKNHHFTLYDVRAEDRPSKTSWTNYLDFRKVTVPQYNLRIGYFISDQYSISIAWDHLKYVVPAGQFVRISGEISEGTSYDGSYQNELIEIERDFLYFEHTNGLNTANVEVRRYDELVHTKIFRIEVIEGVGFGLLVPRSEVEIVGKINHDAFHLSGYELHGLVGLKLGVGRTLFVQSEFKLGYNNMNDILTTIDSSDRASQHFLSYQWNIILGAYFGLPKFRS